MSLTQFLITAAIAILVTVPIVLLIPRARKSPLFDRVLWMATWALAFLGEWSAPNYLGSASTMNQWMIEQLPLIPILIGASVGALSINSILWLMDRFSPPIAEEDGEPESSLTIDEQTTDLVQPQTTDNPPPPDQSPIQN